MKGASLVPGPDPSFSADYDDNGNLKTKSGMGTYSYQPTHPHAGTGSASYQYDANGNMLSGGSASGSRAVTWASYNLPTHIKDGNAVVSLAYGAERQRIRQESISSTNGNRGITWAIAMKWT